MMIESTSWLAAHASLLLALHESQPALLAATRVMHVNLNTASMASNDCKLLLYCTQPCGKLWLA
jgi:hypothetical protein